MLLENAHSWLAADLPAAAMPALSIESPEADARPGAPWPAARIETAELLWGEGFLFPGGADEILRLARPLGLSSTAKLMLVGTGSGGVPRTIASQLGVSVSGFESDPDLAALAAERCTRARLGRRAQVEMWYPHSPSFHPHAYHHGIALEPLREGKPEPVLAALAGALKPGGQLMLVDMVADDPLDPADPTVAEWCRLEHRSAEPPSERAVSRVLGRLGFDIRSAEDMTERHIHLAVLGWRVAVRAMKAQQPAPARAALMVAEAELWMLRLRLMREGRVRMVRWHAIAPRRELGRGVGRRSSTEGGIGQGRLLDSRVQHP